MNAPTPTDHHEVAALQRLAVNVLLRAFLDLRCQEPHLREQARAWLLDSPDLAWWTEIAGVDADRLRASVRNGDAERSKARGRKQHASRGRATSAA